jgi:DNA-binding transcriptional MerR regulator
VDKSPDAFRTISEVADDLDIPQHVLRFWETRFAQIKPLKRGGGRRYYRPDDVELLKGIRHLLYGEGYTIKGVQRILKEEGVRFVQAAWREGAPQPQTPDVEDIDDEDIREDDEVLPSPEPLDRPAGAAPALAREAEPSSRNGRKAHIAAAAPSPDPSITSDERRRLQVVMAELAECKRILTLARQDRDPGDQTS